jgi:hypothetical protein
MVRRLPPTPRCQRQQTIYFVRSQRSLPGQLLNHIIPLSSKPLLEELRETLESKDDQPYRADRTK